jgi:hypothetical protein
MRTVPVFVPYAVTNPKYAEQRTSERRKSLNPSGYWHFRWCREGGSNPHDLAIGGF